MFFLVCWNCEVKEKCYQAHVMNLLLFFILESVSMIIVLICYKNMTVFSKSVSSFLFVQEILYMVMLDYLLRYITSVSKSGQKLVLSMTVAYSHDVNLRTSYFSIISFCLYAWETRHLRYNIGKLWETWGYKFASIHHFNSEIAVLHIDETPVKGCVRYIFASLFCLSEREHLWNKEKCFLFYFESSFHPWHNQILNFQIVKCHDFIKCSSIKHKTHFIE